MAQVVCVSILVGSTMRLDLELPDFDQLYRSAEDSFKNCISGEDTGNAPE